MKHLKQFCIGCERSKAQLETAGIKFNKEHLVPEWLILRCGTDKTYVQWLGKRVRALNVTIPLCKECNDLFGKYLESPVSTIFGKLESGLGINDYEAELLIRWMWKFEGMQWHFNHPNQVYSERYTLRERILGKIDDIRPYLTLAVSRLMTIDPQHGDKPMGIDSYTEISGLFVSGVFSELAIMTSYRRFDDYIPYAFSLYHLQPVLDKLNNTVVFYPKRGFRDDNDAVAITKSSSLKLARLHDIWLNTYSP